ncbi:hypothetical protein DYB25_008255 [Aphanomyces astaci]|uniref:Uncharacterized protein n=1 Tax=Aphanomyces astaci TaxID=112090 RepID=A0A397BAS9_APHAT|nr:hypothetical protein DYB25_008255 [Aphanomyces astaci]
MLLFEATLATANDILRSLTYQPDRDYNFDWAGDGTSTLCMHPQQSLESIHVEAIESTLLSTPLLASSCTSSQPTTLDLQAVKLDWPVSVAAVNDPPTLSHILPSMLLVAVKNSNYSCARLPSSISIDDIDVNEVPYGGHLSVVLDIVPLGAALMTVDRIQAVGNVISATDLTSGGGIASSFTNSTHVVASKVQLEGTMASLNQFLPQVLVCGSTNATLTITVSDNGGCGALQSLHGTASLQVIVATRRSSSVPTTPSNSAARHPFSIDGLPVVAPDATIATSQVASTTLVQLTAFPTPATAFKRRQRQVTQVTISPIFNPSVVVLSIVPRGTGPVTGQFQLTVRFHDVSCVTQPIAYPVTGAGLEATFTEVQTRCGAATFPQFQTVSFRFPIPAALVQPTDGTMVWSVGNNPRTVVLSIAASPAAIQSALRAATGSNAIVVVKMDGGDAFTSIFQVQGIAGTSIVSVPVVQWWMSNGTVASTVTPSTSVQAWALPIVARCHNANVCTLQFLNDDVPAVTLWSNALVDHSANVPPEGNNGIVVVRPEIQLVVPPPTRPYLLFANDVLVNTTDAQWGWQHRVDDGVVMDTVSHISTTSWTITYTSASPMRFRVEPRGLYTVTAELIAAVDVMALTLSVDNQPPTAFQWPLDRAEVVQSRQNHKTAGPSNAAPRLRYAGSQAAPSLTVRPGQSLRIELELVDIIATTNGQDQPIEMHLDAKIGWLAWDLATRYRVQYTVGSLAGGRTLVVASSLDNLQQALHGLYYTAPASYYGPDTLTFRIGGLHDDATAATAPLQVQVDVPLVLLPPEITSSSPLSSNLRAVEDTVLMFTGLFHVHFSPTTPSTCSSTLAVTMITQSGRMLTRQNDLVRPRPPNVDMFNTPHLELLSNDPLLGVDMDDVVYLPKPNFAGVDTLAIHAAQVTTCGVVNVTAEAFRHVWILVEPVADALELHWSNSTFHVASPLSTSSATLLPPVTLSAADAQFALFSNSYAVEVTAMATVGTVFFASSNPPRNVVVCSVHEAPTFLRQLMYTPSNSSATAFDLLSDLVVVTARPFGSVDPPVQVTLNVSIPPSINHPAECASFSAVHVDVQEDLVTELTSFIKYPRRRPRGITVVASVKTGWLSVDGPTNFTNRVKQVVVDTPRRLFYQPSVNFAGQDKLQLSCRNGQVVTFTSTLPVTVHAVNDVPTWDAVATNITVQSGTLNGVCNLWTLRDVDASSRSVYRVVLTVYGGQITLPTFLPGMYVETLNQIDKQEHVLRGSLDHLNSLFTSCEMTFAATPTYHLSPLPTEASTTNSRLVICVEELLSLPNEVSAPQIDPQCASVLLDINY